VLLNIEHLSKIEIAREKISWRGLTDLVCVLACTMALQELGHSFVSVEFEVFGKVQGKLFSHTFN
jgi:hypothetical protein